MREFEKVFEGIKEHYPNILHESVYTEKIENIEEKITIIGKSLQKALDKFGADKLKKYFRDLKITVAPDVFLDGNSIFIIVYLKRETVEEGMKVFDKLENIVFDDYPYRDIHILYSF